MAEERSFVCEDGRALHRKGLLSAERLAAWTALGAAAGAIADEHRELLTQEFDELLTTVRVEQNQRHEAGFQDADLVAVAAGGLLGALNAWMRPATPAPAATPTPTPVPVSIPAPTPATSLWASAFDAAQASLNVVRQRRQLDHLRIEHLHGDPATARHVLLCINGFMTQGADPRRNWGPWAETDPSVVLYAVHWEAGDVGAWNAFCAHANEHFTASSAHALWTQNPWHQAEHKAEQVGKALARALAARPTCTRGRRVSLLGHSLGGAVVYHTLEALPESTADDKDPLVQHALIFAGAFLPPTRPGAFRDLTRRLAPGNGRLINVYSTRDEVLAKLFWAIQLGGKDAVAAGAGPIDAGNAVHNVDVADLVAPRVPNQFGHSYGGSAMSSIRMRILTQFPELFAS